MNVGQAWGILRGRRHGDRKRADKFLRSMSLAEGKERNKQDAQTKGSKRSKKPYRLGESVRVRTRK